MPRTIRHLTMLLAAVAAVVAPAVPAGALGLAPAPAVDKPNLWAVPEVVCVGPSTPGLKWTMGNDTNGTHMFSLQVSGSHVASMVLKPGEVRTRQFQSPVWEDTSVHFAVVWQSQGTIIAETTPWLSCAEPELSYSFAKVDDQGRPCAGLVEVVLTNSGTQAAEVRLQAGAGLGQTTQFTLSAGSSVTKQTHVGTGTWVVASYYRPFFDGWEFFLEHPIVDCADSLPNLPLPAPPAEPPLTSPSQDPAPGEGTLIWLKDRTQAVAGEGTLIWLVRLVVGALTRAADLG